VFPLVLALDITISQNNTQEPTYTASTVSPESGSVNVTVVDAEETQAGGKSTVLFSQVGGLLDTASPVTLKLSLQLIQSLSVAVTLKS
jgi:hypothetical protein